MADEAFRVEGADALLKLGKRLKANHGQPVVKELQKALVKGAKPITPAARANTSRLPQAGGLAARVKKAPIRTTARIGNTTTSVRVSVAGKKSGAYGANVGKVRHPVFGRKGSDGKRRFVEQDVPPGWFDDAAESEGPKAREDVVTVMTDFAERLTKPL